MKIHSNGHLFIKQDKQQSYKAIKLALYIATGHLVYLHPWVQAHSWYKYEHEKWNKQNDEKCHIM